MKLPLFFSIAISGLLFFTPPAFTQTTVAPTLSNIKEGQKIDGFTAVAVYLNDAGQPMGGRFMHDRTGFILDLLQIESVPQTFIWVNTLPVSDKGEPHTQEHLLITKGNKGHELNTREGMSLAYSNAFTSQIYTAYDFYTGAGGDVFYKLFKEYLDALLHPDYSDEEVHREVCNWGVAKDAATNKLKIEEKGSVYNEMKTTMNNPYAVIFNAMGRLLYGDRHPLALESGGLPDSIRVLDAAAIKKFHDRNYHLGNMGAITSLPKTMALASVLQETNTILNSLQPQEEQKVFTNTIPDPLPAPEGTVQIVEYPSTNELDPGLMAFAYPATLTLGATEQLLLNNFLSVFAGDASTNLYKLFIDSKTRKIDLGAQGLYAWADTKYGHPVFIMLTDVNAASLTKEKAAIVWQYIEEELNRIASFKGGSDELKEFNRRFRNSLTNNERSLAKFTNTPPKFGFRNTGEDWYLQVEEMKNIPGFRKSIILKPQFHAIDSLLATGKNFWSTYLNKWKLATSLPYAIIAKANPSLIAIQDSATRQRTNAELAVLKEKYHVANDQEAILKYKADYDANTLELEKAEQSHQIKFIDHPPLTLDDQLNFKTTSLAGNIPMVASTFNNMTGATTGLALRLDNLPEDKLIYLAMLPQLLTGTGILKNGKATSYEEMLQLQQQQILSLTADLSTNPRTGRAELIVEGAGNNADESRRAVRWMNDVLQYPNWSEHNLSRIRDLVDQVLNNKRKRMQNPEESWVGDPSTAYRSQNKPLLLATASFLTAEHNIFRLRWMLMDAGNNTERNAAASFIDKLGTVKAGRKDLEKLVAKMENSRDTSLMVPAFMKTVVSAFEGLSAKAAVTAREAAKDLGQTLNEIPDESLGTDWEYVCGVMKHDLLQTPEKTLAALNGVRKTILHSANARMFEIGSGSTQEKLQKNINELLSGLSGERVSRVTYPDRNIIFDRLRERSGNTQDPVYVGLVNPNSTTGVFINTVPLVTYADTSREKLLQFLASELFAGGGKQSVYTKSTGAGLSYSTGVGANPGSGLFMYYAERTPLLPQTLSFIIDEIKRTPDDPAMSEYIFSLAVSGLRSASEYEARGEAMAADLADGLTPSVVRNFRKSILRLRNMPGLMNEVYRRKDEVYEKILPGYNTNINSFPGGCYYVIGPEKQMNAYESYLQSKYGTDTKLYRIYPRDYWMVNQ